MVSLEGLVVVLNQIQVVVACLVVEPCLVVEGAFLGEVPYLVVEGEVEEAFLLLQ